MILENFYTIKSITKNDDNRYVVIILVNEEHDKLKLG